MTGSPRPVGLVTGASRGIGLTIARSLAAAGYDLTISARNAAGLADVAAELSAAGGTVRPHRADMAVEQDVTGLAAEHVEAYDRLDVLVMSAGIGYAAALDTAPLHRFDRQFAVNVRAPYVLVQALLPVMRTTARDHPTRGVKIIALSSITGVYAEPALAAYGATKAALASLCRSINAEVSGAGVSATAICPGYVHTDMTAWMHEQLDPTSMIATADIAELVMSVTRLSAHAVVPEIVVTRPGEQLHRA
ncbi:MULTISPECIES: SDR family oxidoreductase [unclassified Frankia]|uniref:SDR family NAD(P)-dependent oxidoreductase n=1 Tax=unclassified Frankia TaxID=2632575 RepID=UPI002AD35416|nr:MULTISPECIES: SDR family oxidoreductase [unclassified Frankia]